MKGNKKKDFYAFCAQQVEGPSGYIEGVLSVEEKAFVYLKVVLCHQFVYEKSSRCRNHFQNKFTL